MSEPLYYLSEFLRLREWMRSALRQKGYGDDALHNMDVEAEKNALNAVLFPARPAHTARVRIAVCVAADGTWNSCGWRTKSMSPSDEELAASAADVMPADATLHFVEADVPLPTTIEGEVKP